MIYANFFILALDNKSLNMRIWLKFMIRKKNAVINIFLAILYISDLKNLFNYRSFKIYTKNSFKFKFPFISLF